MLRQNVGKRIRTQATPCLFINRVFPPLIPERIREKGGISRRPLIRKGTKLHGTVARLRDISFVADSFYFLSRRRREPKKRFIGYRYIEERRADPISIIELRRLSSSWPGSRSAAASGGGGGFIGPIASPGASRAVLIIYTTGIKINFM